MTAAAVKSEGKTVEFRGSEGNKLVADQFGEQGRPVLLLHGGGQTRHAWGRTAQQLAEMGFVAVAMDQRGHGDSDWVESGAYDFLSFAADARLVAAELQNQFGARPAAIGASLGGVAILTAEGEASRGRLASIFAALVLVDITPRVDVKGVEKIRGFMSAHADEGFASIDEAADVVAAYLPHRPRPKSTEGLKKNLRLHPDGRWRWHWDPRNVTSRFPHDTTPAQVEAMLIDYARQLKEPVLLVRGGSSEIVSEDHVEEFLQLVPQAQYANVADAHHMVAGDKNDQFSAAILQFLKAIAVPRVEHAQ
jgi:pimeloyl-ACP methyl ester carboxylesterase